MRWAFQDIIIELIRPRNNSQNGKWDPEWFTIGQGERPSIGLMFKFHWWTHNYAADNTLIARTSEELLELIKKVKVTCEQSRLYLNIMIRGNELQQSMVVDGEEVDQYDQLDTFNFLGLMIVKDSRSSVDIRRRLTLLWPINAAVNGKLELTLLKGRQRFNTVSTSNLKV